MQCNLKFYILSGNVHDFFLVKLELTVCLLLFISYIE